MKRFLIHKHHKEQTPSPEDELGGYKSYTEKELFTQDSLIRNFTKRHIKSGKIKFDNVKIPFEKIKRIYIIGNGGDYACAIAAAYNAEVLCDTAAFSETITEFIYSNPRLDKNTLVILFARSVNSKECMQVSDRLKGSSSKLLSIVSEGDNRENVISVNMTQRSRLPHCAFTLKYLASVMLMIGIGNKSRVITELYNTIALNGFSTIHKRVADILNAKNIIERASESISTESLAITGINIDYAQSIYASILLNEKEGSITRPITADMSFNESNLLAIASSKDFANILMQKCSPGVIIIPDSIEPEGLISISYEDTIPLLTPIISATVLQLIAYFKFKNNDNN